MQRLEGQCLQHQQVESSTQKIGSFFTHGVLLSEYDSRCLIVPNNLEEDAWGPDGNSSQAEGSTRSFVAARLGAVSARKGFLADCGEFCPNAGMNFLEFRQPREFM
jgi:hypothetical protein